MHGFLVLRTREGKKIADGEMTQVVNEDRVTDRLIFRFTDGSVYEDTAVFSQKQRFRFLSDHLVERGPSFQKPMETLIDASTGEVTVHYQGSDGKEKVLNQKFDVPPDLANGLMFTLVKDIEPSARLTTVPMLVTTPKPRLVKLEIFTEGQKTIASGNIKHKALIYDVKVKIGGMAGLVTRVAGKQPPDTQVWVLTGEAPAFVKSEGPLYQDGPVWRMELANPTTGLPQ